LRLFLLGELLGVQLIEKHVEPTCPRRAESIECGVHLDPRRAVRLVDLEQAALGGSGDL